MRESKVSQVERVLLGMIVLSQVERVLWGPDYVVLSVEMLLLLVYGILNGEIEM